MGSADASGREVTLLFDSVASPFQAHYVVYDNLEVVPEPASMALLALGSLALVRRRR